ncbi:MAG: sulfotransferase [Deltaproteobacteria bacterium]|nr:sulfotransferase [Deltaproteobacteria bacterium]MBN2671635.1 sulfotransferase [Deltaproteobacteria bacterium]
MNSLPTTSTDYAHPYRPALVKAYNIAARPFFSKALATLTSEKLIAHAVRAERFDHLGRNEIETPLEVLLNAIRNEANLSPFGLFVTKQRLLNLLRNRLRVNKLLSDHPEINDVKITPPILITGLQRTGTTLLHRLLTLDPDHRALLSYEALNPAPLHANPQVDKKKKQKLAHTAQKALSYIAPDFFAIHPVEAAAPEEDVLLLDYALISTVAESTLRVPSYARWVERADNRPAYEYLKLLLKVLSWRTPTRTWILKSPHHLEFLADFAAVFPEATVVMTHRDPTATLPSFCSMMAHGRGIFSDVVDPVEIGDHWLRKTARMLKKSQQYRTEHPSARIVDIYYDDFIAHPIDQIQRIYRASEKPFIEESAELVRTGLQQNRQHKYGVHKYDLTSFGLTEEKIRAAYGELYGK